MAKALKETKIRIGEDEGWTKLLQLKDLTSRTGMLHELQVMQLKMWPLVFLNAKNATTEFGYETKLVVYHVDIEGRKPAKFKWRLEHLDKATKKLLGGEYSVVVNVNKKQVYNGSAISDT